MGHPLGFIERGSTLLMNLNYIQELYLYLHLYDVHSVDTFSPSFNWNDTTSTTTGLKSWKDIPPVLCVTLKVPRKKLGVITSLKPTEIGSPILHCVVQSSQSSTSWRWQNIFSAIQLSFGTISRSGEIYSDTFRVHVAGDELRWNGSSPLFVTFMVPTWMLLLEPKRATIAFGIQSTPASSATFIASLGVEVNVYATSLGNEQNVFFSRSPPNQPESAPLCAFSDDKLKNPASSNEITRTLVTAGVDLGTGRIASLIGHLEVLSAEINAALQSGCKVETLQTSPLAFTETLGSKPWRITLDFPVPVPALKQKTRIARKSSYIEVEAPLADATSWRFFPSFIYPTFLGSGTPTAWNTPYLNLERLPIIDTAKKKELQWLITHMSGMFNIRERALKAKSVLADSEKDIRMDFKDSLSSMFMTFTSLQDQHTRLFALTTP
jgi:hypothetical protein